MWEPRLLNIQALSKEILMGENVKNNHKCKKLTKKFRIISSNDSGKSYSVINAVDNVSFDVEIGIFWYLGPNGYGKTTLLKLLVCLWL